jgi:predicted CoA-binding protein
VTIRPTVAVIGASRDRSKFGNISVRAHLQQGYEVFPVNPNAAEVEGIPAFESLSDVPIENLDRVTIYLPPDLTLELLDEIHEVAPAAEVWLNPGSADEDVRVRAEQLGIEIIEACSIVDLGVSPSSV